MFDKIKEPYMGTVGGLAETFITEVTKKTEGDLVNAVVTYSARIGISINEEKVKELILKSQKRVPPYNVIGEKMVFFCPKCSRPFSNVVLTDKNTIPSYCDKCGQAVSFEEYERIAKHSGGISNG